MSDTASRVNTIIADVLDVDPSKLRPETLFEGDPFLGDITADDMDVAELLMELEEEFDIAIPDDVVERVKTVGEVVEAINEILEA